MLIVLKEPLFSRGGFLFSFKIDLVCFLGATLIKEPLTLLPPISFSSLLKIISTSSSLLGKTRQDAAIDGFTLGTNLILTIFFGLFLSVDSS